MTAEQINQILYRSLKSGIEYNRYFSKSECKVTPLAKGNTKVALSKMKLWANKYAHQAKNIAQVLKGNSLKQTCENIHQFLYWHIQYKIDLSDQNLLSPDCAWQTRQIGTDCKSYSVFASTILQNLGIKHYFRRIRQEAMHKDAYTHVYVVIPKNQKTTKRELPLTEDIHVIDATINTNKELAFLGKDDLYMEPSLQINGLAIPKMDCGCGCNQDKEVVAINEHPNHNFAVQANEHGLGFSYLGFADPATVATVSQLVPVDDLFSSVFSGLGDIFNAGLSCINSTYTPSKVEQRVNDVLLPWLNQQLSAINQSNPVVALAQLQNLMKHIRGSYQGVKGASTESKWRNCSRKSLNLFVDFWSKTFTEVENTRNNLVSQLSNSGYGLSESTNTYSSKQWDVGDKPDTYQGDIGLNVYGANYRSPYDTFQIKEYVVTSVSNTGGNISIGDVSFDPIDGYNNFDPNIGGLIDIIGGGNNQGGGFNNGSGINNGTDINNGPINTNKPTVQKAGFGMVFGILVTAGIAYGIATSGNKNKKKTA